VDHAARLGAQTLTQLQQMQKEQPAVFTNARGRGLLMAVDLVDPSRRPAIMSRIFELGMLILPTGTKGIRFRPSLNVTQGELDQAIDILSRAARDVGAGRSAVAV
jgi:L-lysine 6-transaminase